MIPPDESFRPLATPMATGDSARAGAPLRPLPAGRVFMSVLVACVLACASPAPPRADAIATAEPGIAARNANGMVVSGATHATEVGIRILEDGGNAVDAAVATAFALAVVEPTMSGLGGRTQLVLRTADGTIAAIDGTTEVPAAYSGGPVDDEDAYGYATIAVPGTVAALTMALRDHGSLSLSRVVQPAIELAENGFLLPAAEAGRIASAARRLREFESSRAYFLKPDGSPFAAGDRFRQPDLAATLRAIAEGGEDAFYRGALAGRIVAGIREHGGLVTEQDMAAYRAETSIVVHGSYRGHELIGSYLPASGATTIEILQILDRADLPSIAGSADWAAAVSRALLAGFADREVEMLPAARKAEWLTSPELADARASVLGFQAEPGPGTARRTAQRSRAASGSPLPRRAALGETAGAARPVGEPEFTTHLSVADRNGVIVALTQSVGPLMGSKVAAPGLGFLHAATMQYLGDLEPGTRRHWSSQSPLLILRDGQPAYVLGGAGARRIISGIVETVSRLLDEHLPLDAALAAPRFHPTPGRIDVEVRPGAAWAESDIAQLVRSGLTIRQRDDAPYFARINAIARDPLTDEWVGVADPRWQGAAGGPRR